MKSVATANIANRRQRIAMYMCLPLLTLISGCWDWEEIQSQNYISSVGVQYSDEQYEIYAQMLNFDSIAKIEGKSAMSEAWIGYGRGRSFIDASRIITETGQRKLFLGHVSSIVVTENLLRSGKLYDVIDLALRGQTMRYTKWFYASRSPLRQLLSTKGFFNRSPLETTLIEPMRTYNEFSNNTPIYMNDLVAHLHEVNSVALIPELSLKRQVWTVGDKPMDVVMRDGIFVMEGNTYKGYLNHRTVLQGRWLEPEFRKTQLSVELPDGMSVTVAIKRTKRKFGMKERADEPVFRLKAHYLMRITNMDTETPYREIERLVEARIRDDIAAYYRSGLAIGADLLGLGHRYYVRHPGRWKKRSIAGKLPIDADSLAQIEVRCRMTEAGSYKLSK